MTGRRQASKSGEGPRSRELLATLLDLAIVASISAAVVIALGGRTKLAVAGFRLQVLSPWRSAATAVILAALRLWSAGTLPPLPLLNSPWLRAWLDAERARFATPPPRPRGFAVYAAAVAVASLVWLTPHLRDIRQVPDPGDPIFSAWRLARFAHQLAHDPRHLFDGNIFYPESRTLTYSDATVLQGLIAAPFILAGADPLIVSNALFLAAFPLSGLAFFFAAWRLTGALRAAFIAGILGALYPFHTEHYSHLELQYFFFVPLAIVALLDLLAAPTMRTGAMVGALVCAQWLASMYFGIMLLTFLVPLGAIVTIGWHVRPSIALLRSLTIASLIVAVALAAVAVPYMRSRDTRGDRDFALVRLSSATPSDYGRPHARLASYQWKTRESNKPERELFPGVVAPALTIAGVVPPIAAVGTATFVAGLMAFDWSLGANGLTYDDLYKWLLPYRGMRVAARFSVFVGTALILLAAYGADRLLRVARRFHVEGVAFAVLAAAALVDLRATIQLQDYWRTVPSIYATVGPEMVLAEFPFEPGVDQMYFSTRHWARLLNGYSGFFPESFIRMARALSSLPSEQALNDLRAAGTTHITVNCRLYGERCGRVLEWLDDRAGLRLVASGRWEGAEVRLYALR